MTNGVEIPMAFTKKLLTSILVLSTFALTACSDNEPAQEEAAAQTFITAPLINPNDASEVQLAAISGLSQADVATIVSGRPFAAMSDLHAAISDGKDPQALKALYTIVFIKVGLNTGSEDDYKLIPSSLSPSHLAHEFDEYRPYASMDDFAREMKKYVSAAEVENLKRYVTLD